MSNEPNDFTEVRNFFYGVCSAAMLLGAAIIGAIIWGT